MTWREEQAAEIDGALADHSATMEREDAEVQAAAIEISRALCEALRAAGFPADRAEDQASRLAEGVRGLDVAVRGLRRFRQSREALLAVLRQWEREAKSRDARKALQRVRARVERTTKI
jgi:hypothetical protein